MVTWRRVFPVLLTSILWVMGSPGSPTSWVRLVERVMFSWAVTVARKPTDPRENGETVEARARMSPYCPWAGA